VSPPERNWFNLSFVVGRFIGKGENLGLFELAFINEFGEKRIENPMSP